MSFKQLKRYYSMISFELSHEVRRTVGLGGHKTGDAHYAANTYVRVCKYVGVEVTGGASGGARKPSLDSPAQTQIHKTRYRVHLPAQNFS